MTVYLERAPELFFTTFDLKKMKFIKTQLLSYNDVYSSPNQSRIYEPLALIKGDKENLSYLYHLYGYLVVSNFPENKIAIKKLLKEPEQTNQKIKKNGKYMGCIFNM